MALLVLSTAATTAHYAFVQHALCEAHGDAIHVSPDAEHHSEHSGENALGTRTPPTSHSHDHCELLATQRETVQSDVTPLAFAGLLPLAQRVPAPVVLACAARSVPTFRLAPKLSPPV